MWMKTQKKIFVTHHHFICPWNCNFTGRKCRTYIVSGLDMLSKQNLHPRKGITESGYWGDVGTKTGQLSPNSFWRQVSLVLSLPLVSPQFLFVSLPFFPPFAFSPHHLSSLNWNWFLPNHFPKSLKSWFQLLSPDSALNETSPHCWNSLWRQQNEIWHHCWNFPPNRHCCQLSEVVSALLDFPSHPRQHHPTPHHHHRHPPIHRRRWHLISKLKQ